MTSPEVGIQNYLSHTRHSFISTIQLVQTMNNKVVCTPFLRRDSTDKQGFAPVYLNISINGERDKQPLNFKINEVFWNESQKRVKPSHPSAIDFNRNIDTLVQRINKIVSDANFENTVVTKDLLHKRLHTQQITGDFIGYMIAAINSRQDIKASSKKNQLRSAHLLTEFKPIILASELNQSTIKQYKNFLERRKYSANYIHNQFKNIKSYYNQLQVDTGIKMPPIFGGIKTSWHKTSITFLEFSELKKMMEHYHEIKNSATVRPSYIIALRYYLFSCHTGLRISDINNLAQSYFFEDTITIDLVKRKKGRGKKHRVPLNKIAKQLWLDIAESNFANITDQQKNKLVKEAAKNVGINKKLNYHTSRHTCATSLLQLGSPLPSVQELLDHADIKTTMIYNHVTSKDMQRAVALLENI